MKDWTTPRTAQRVLFAAVSANLGGGNRALLLTGTELRRRGIEVQLLFPREGPAVEEARGRGLETTILPLRAPELAAPWATIKSTARAVRRMLAWSPHVVHANDIAVARPLALAARFTGAKLVCQVQRPHPLSESELRWAFRGSPAPRLMIDVCRALGDQNAVMVRRYLPRTAHAVVHNGVDLAELAPSSARGDKARRRIGYVANLIPVKRHDDLLDMLPRVAEVHPNVELWLIGDDQLDPAHAAHLKQRCEANGELRERVRFLGRRTDVPALLAQIDLLVHAAEHEACSLALIEALACGVPVVACDVGGNREIIEDGRSGWLVPPHRPDLLAERSAAVLGDHRARSLVAVNGRRRAEQHFDIKRTTATLLDLYREAGAASGVVRSR